MLIIFGAVHLIPFVRSMTTEPADPLEAAAIRAMTDVKVDLGPFHSNFAMLTHLLSASYLRDSLDKIRASFTQKYPGEEAFSDAATRDWSQSYKEFREHREQVEAFARLDEIKAQMAPLLQTDVSNEYNSEGSVDCGYVWLYLRK